MTNGGQRPDPSGFRIENEMDLLFGRAHPNPTREGCPPPELLRRLARRELPIGDPAYDHFAKCSPCYQELRTLQQADAAKLVAVAKRRRMMIAAAAVLAVAIAGSWFALRRAGDADRIARADDSNGATVSETGPAPTCSHSQRRAESRSRTSRGAARPCERHDTAAGWLIAWRVRRSNSRRGLACEGYREGLGGDSQLRHNSRSRD